MPFSNASISDLLANATPPAPPAPAPAPALASTLVATLATTLATTLAPAPAPGLAQTLAPTVVPSVVAGANSSSNATGTPAFEDRVLELASEQGHLHLVLAAYCALLLVFFFGMSGSLTLRRKIFPPKRQAEEGLLTSGADPPLLRRASSFFCFVLVLLPLLLASLIILLAPLYCAAEGWTFGSSVDYTIAGVAQLSYSITEVQPTTLAGKTLDVILELYSYVACQVVTGLVAGLSFMRTLQSTIPPTWGGLLRFGLIYLPFVLAVNIACCGCVLGYIEDWGPGHGILYMSSALLGLPRPLSQVTTPATDVGKLLDIGSLVFETAINGAAIGFVLSHSKIDDVMEFIEGRMLDKDSDSPSVARKFKVGGGASGAPLLGGPGDELGSIIASGQWPPDTETLEWVMRKEAQEIEQLQSLVAQRQWRLNHLQVEWQRAVAGAEDPVDDSVDPFMSKWSRTGPPPHDSAYTNNRQRAAGGRGGAMRRDADDDDSGSEDVLC